MRAPARLLALRRLRPLALVAAACLAAGPCLERPARAGDDLASDPPDPLTNLEAGPLSRADLVVLGTVHVIRRGGAGGATLVRVDVTKTLKAAPGAAPEESLNLFVVGERPTKEASARSREWFRSDAPGDHVLFLRRSPAGSGWTLDTAFEVDGEIGREKAAVLEKEIALAAVRDPGERRRKTLSHLLDLLASERPWSRAHAARELGAVATTAPEVFEEKVLVEIDAARTSAREPEVRALLTDAIERASPGWRPTKPLGPGSGGPSDPATGAEGDAPRVAVRADLEPLRRRVRDAEGDEARCTALSALAKAGAAAVTTDLLDAFADPSAAVRERAAVLVGDVGAKAAVPTLVAAFETEKETPVREAIVRAVGLAGGPGSVTWLVARLREEGLGRAALFALARIRTAAAMEALGKERERLLALDPPDRGAAKLLDYLRSEAFVAAEAAAGRDLDARSGGANGKGSAATGPR